MSKINILKNYFAETAISFEGGRWHFEGVGCVTANRESFKDIQKKTKKKQQTTNNIIACKFSKLPSISDFVFFFEK